MNKTKIEWTDVTWNPITGCAKISEGCRNCYAERMARRLAGRYGYSEQPHHFDVTLHPDRLEEPLHWRKPRMVFVCSMGDLFHKDVPFTFITDVFMVMASAENHTFQILTKRPQRMRNYFDFWAQLLKADEIKPLPNVWLGVSCENQAVADERIPILLRTPAAVRFVSCEPLLGPINLSYYLANNSLFKANRDGHVFHGEQQADGSIIAVCKDGSFYHDGIDLHWVIAGGESGPGARPMHPDWARGIKGQCQAAGVPFFFKQWGAWIPFGQGKGDVISGRVTECWLDIRGQANPTYSAMMREPSKLFRVGKKRACRLLDGREWNEWPTGAK